MPISRLSPSANIYDQPLRLQRSCVSKISVELSKVRNHIANFSECRRDIIRRISESSGHLKHIQIIAIQTTGDVAIRFKKIDSGKNGQIQGRFKADESSTLKRWVHGRRYTQECEAAAAKLGLKAHGPVNLNTAMRHVNHQVRAQKSELKEFDKEFGDSMALLPKKESKLVKLLSLAEFKLSSVEHEFNKIEAKAELNAKKWEMFSNAYQSKHGFRQLNAEARRIYAKTGKGGVLRAKDIISHYERRFGPDVFHGWAGKKLKNSIKESCYNITGLTTHAAESCYLPSHRQRTTFRGQGMTDDGFRKLCESSDGQIYSAGQFLSTSDKESVARKFPSPDTANPLDKIHVIFKINGDSGARLLPTSDIAYTNKEYEILYSPLACFTVDSIQETQTGYAVTLNEVEFSPSAPALPY